MDKLNDIQIRNLKPAEKEYKKHIGKGLNIVVKPSGRKIWRLKYRYGNKEKSLTIGEYPIISLKEAKNKRFEALKLLSDGIDPSKHKQAQKLAIKDAYKNTFEVVAEEWFITRVKDKSESHQKRTKSNLARFLYPAFKTMPIKEIEPLIVLNMLQKIAQSGRIETMSRVKQTASQIFDYAVATGRLKNNPTLSLARALPKAKTKHYPTILDKKEIGKLLVAIDEYQGIPQVMTALKIAPYMMLRPGELRHMEWEEINWNKKILEISAEKMKIREPHIVPLCKQVVRELEELRPITEHYSKYVFPSARSKDRPISENAVGVALKTLGYTGDKIVPHGFRAMARTILDEDLKVRVDYIEHQLAHSVKDPNGRAYNRTKHLEERAEMMQKWADYLDSLKLKIFN
jgi:integrase